MRLSLAAFILTGLLLPACTLEQAAPTPTIHPDILQTWTPVPVTPIVQPTAASPAPAGQVVPTALPLNQTDSAEPPRPVTPVLLTPLPPGAQAVPGPGTAGAAARYTLTLRSGETVGVNYAIHVLTGSVTLVFQGAEGVLWQQTFTVSETNRAAVTASRGGVYEVLVFTERFDGSYDLSWD